MMGTHQTATHKNKCLMIGGKQFGKVKKKLQL
jgi:hypothetical protein